jgi:thiamine biosynthesis lipoprotein
MKLVHLDSANRTVRFARTGVMLDLGAIGKGYAIERAAEILRETGIASALIHGGTSTILALGHPPGAEAWIVALELPPHVEGIMLPTVALRDESLSVSSAGGRQFLEGGRRYCHVLDPRTGAPVESTVLSAVAGASATETDALSTALLVAGTAGIDDIASLRPGLKTLVLARAERGWQSEARGFGPTQPGPLRENSVEKSGKRH